MPLIDGGDEKKGKKNDLESRLNDKIFQMTSTQQDAIYKLRQDVDELAKTFQEKIRRQALVREQKKYKTDEDL